MGGKSPPRSVRFLVSTRGIDRYAANSRSEETQAALERLEEIRRIDASRVDLSSIPPSRVKALARYAASAWAPTIARMPDDRRVATPPTAKS